MRKRLCAALAAALAAVFVAAAPAVAITNWTVVAKTPYYDNGYGANLFKGWACANPTCSGPAAWSWIVVTAQDLVTGGWQDISYLCVPSNCGTEDSNNLFGQIQVQACVVNRYYRTRTDAGVLLTGGWQYDTVYSNGVKLC